MADSVPVDMAELQKETKQALLTAIKTKAGSAGTGQLDELAYAYSLVVGAVPGHLPGLPPAK